MIKIINIRKGGYLYHYAHFICDCLFPEIVMELYNHDVVIREKTINQTLGNFSKIYDEVMSIKNIELITEKFNKTNIKLLTNQPKENYLNKVCFDKFTNYIFSKYQIKNLEYISDYPEVILIKRHDRIELISDTYFKNIHYYKDTGKERREISNINMIENHLTVKYGNRFKSLFFEQIPFKKQILYFNNAKLIICAHGAVMSNMFFCKEGTSIIEVTCGVKWDFFDNISNILNLNHIKCENNNYNEIIGYLNKYTV